MASKQQIIDEIVRAYDAFMFSSLEVNVRTNPAWANLCTAISRGRRVANTDYKPDINRLDSRDRFYPKEGPNE